MQSIQSHKDIIDLWPSQSAFRNEIKIDYSKANKWYNRNSIPAPYWVRVVNAADCHGFPVTYQLLAELIAIK